MPTFYNLIVCDYLILSHLAIKGVDIKSSSHFLFFSPAPFSLSVCPLSNCEGWGGESCLCPGPEEQLQHKPAKLTRSPWASHMHYSNQSILDHPDTLDIWGLCILLAVPICFTSPVFFFFLSFSLLSISVDSSLSQLPLCSERLAENFYVTCFHIQSNSDRHMCVWPLHFTGLWCMLDSVQIN